MRGNRQKAQTPREAESEGITDPKQTNLWGSLSSSLGVQISFLSFTPCSHMNLALTPARSSLRSSKGLSSSVTSVTVSCQPLPPDPRLCRVSGRAGGRSVGEEEPEEWPLSASCLSPPTLLHFGCFISTQICGGLVRFSVESADTGFLMLSAGSSSHMYKPRACVCVQCRRRGASV